jgi:hypothetical protein
MIDAAIDEITPLVGTLPAGVPRAGRITRRPVSAPAPAAGPGAAAAAGTGPGAQRR